ncbi:retrovirus-related pol polyprotein from transposon TNT 1-94 [Tanacetum coccineum]
MLSSTGVKPSTSASGSQPSGNTKKDKIQQTPSSTQKNKVKAHSKTVKSSLKNKNCVIEPNGTANVQHSKFNANFELLCVKCNGCMLSDNYDLCVLDFIKDVNAHAKSKSVKKSSKRKVWKPTRKVFTNIEYTWRPTGRTFTIVGNAFPLTRITTTAEVPLRKPTALESDTPKPVVTLVYSRKPRKSKTNVLVSKPKIIKSISANNKEPNKSWGSIVSDVPSSSLDECSTRRPLTRITTTTKVPLRKPTALENETHKPVVTLVYSRKPRKSKTNVPVSKSKVLKSVSANKKEPGQSWGSIVSNVPSSSLDDCRSSKLFSVKFKNDHVAKILGYGDYHIRNVTISRVYYVEGLRHNLFFVGQFCDSNLEVAFRQYTCFIRNLESVDLLTRSRGNNLYTLSLGDMMTSSPICLLSKASKTKSWLWHRRLSHLNFGAINHLARHGLVRGLPKLKFEKDHLCSACAIGKSKKKPPNLNLKTPIKKNSIFCTWIFVDQYVSQVLMERSTSSSLLMITFDLHGLNNGTEFVNQTLREYYEKVDISHETYVAPSPQKNDVVERRNHKLIEATRTMLIYAKASLFLWAKVVATACYTQNCSINLGKLQPKVDIGIFIGYAPTKKAFRIYNRRTRRIIETINVDFDELTTMASEHSSSGPALHEMTPAIISSGLVPNPPPSTLFVPPSRSVWDLLFQPLFDELLTPPPSVDHQAPVVIASIADVVAPEPAASTGSPSSTYHDLDVAHMNNDMFFGILIPENDSEASSSSDVIPTVVHTATPNS